MYLNDLLDGVRFHEGRRDALLDGDDDPVGGLNPDGGRAKLDRFDGVLNLVEKV